MKLGIVVYSSDSETVWNAFRLGNFALKEGDEVIIFLMAKGVEYQKLDNEKFKPSEEAQKLHDTGGKILACGTCLKIRNSEGSELCPLSTMKDLYEMIKSSDRVVSF